MLQIIVALLAPIQRNLIAGALAGRLMLAGFLYGAHDTDEKYSLIATRKKAQDLVVIAATWATDEQTRDESEAVIRDLKAKIEETAVSCLTKTALVLNLLMLTGCASSGVGRATVPPISGPA